MATILSPSVVSENKTPDVMDPKVTDLDEEAMEAQREQEEGVDSSPSGTIQGTTGRVKQNRLEKKSRKALSRLGLKPVQGIMKVTIRKSKHLLFSITNPEVFKCPSSDTYVIFGDAKIDDGSPHGQVPKMPASSAATAPTSVDGAATSGAPASGTATAAPAEDDDASVDATGILEKDIELVMAQGSCSRAKAVAALKLNNNDIVEAIMSVSAN